MLRVHVTNDEVNAYWTRQAAQANSLPIEVRTYYDPMPDGDCERVLFDLDSVPADSRQEVLARLSNGCSFKAAVHSHYLSDAEEDQLRANGVSVFRRLEYKKVVAFFGGR